eukprot:COSAG02_NODE_2070_length_9937_cov_21.671885_1_plen_155_part_10
MEKTRVEENGVENPDLPAHVDKRGHDPGISYISVGDLAKAFYHEQIWTGEWNGETFYKPKLAFPGHRHEMKEKGIDGGGERPHRSLSPSAGRPTQLAGPMHPPQTRRPHPHCPPARQDAPRAVAAPSPAVWVSKSTAVDSVTTWVLRLSWDGHIG